eukprot:457788-Rhodomonas_salina.1
MIGNGLHSNTVRSIVDFVVSASIVAVKSSKCNTRRSNRSQLQVFRAFEVCKLLGQVELEFCERLDVRVRLPSVVPSDCHSMPKLHGNMQSGPKPGNKLYIHELEYTKSTRIYPERGALLRAACKEGPVRNNG